MSRFVVSDKLAGLYVHFKLNHSIRILRPVISCPIRARSKLKWLWWSDSCAMVSSFLFSCRLFSINLVWIQQQLRRHTHTHTHTHNKSKQECAARRWHSLLTNFKTRRHKHHCLTMVNRSCWHGFQCLFIALVAWKVKEVRCLVVPSTTNQYLKRQLHAGWKVTHRHCQSPVQSQSRLYSTTTTSSPSSPDVNLRGSSLTNFVVLPLVSSVLFDQLLVHITGSQDNWISPFLLATCHPNPCLP